MQVQNMGNHYANGLQRDRLSNSNSASDTGNSRGRQAEAAIPAPMLGAPVQTAAQPTEKTAAAMPSSQNQGSGVVQKLQEGHFQGVANVRLMINFQQQIQLSNSRQAGEALQAGSTELLSGLGERMAALGEEFHGIGEGIDFGEEVSSLMFSFTSTVEGFFAVSDDSGFDPNGVLTAIHSAFQDFFSSVSQFGLTPAALVEPTMEEAAVEDQVVDGAIAAVDDLAAGETAVEEGASMTDPAGSAEESVAESSEAAEAQGFAPDAEVVAATEEISGDEAEVAAADEVSGEEVVAAQETGMEDTQATSFTAAMQDLQSWFDTQWESMRSTIDQVMAMPPLSEPRGNGVAYSRFLAIYSELDGGSASDTGSTGSLGGGISTQA